MTIFNKKKSEALQPTGPPPESSILMAMRAHLRDKLAVLRSQESLTALVRAEVHSIQDEIQWIERNPEGEKIMRSVMGRVVPLK